MNGTVVLYLVTLAVWLVLVGAVVNGARPAVLGVLGVGGALGVLAIVLTDFRLLVPVVLCWLLGVVALVRDERRAG